MKRYKAAIIGCGRIGSEFDKSLVKRIAYSHAGAYSIHPRIELVAACDSNPAKLNAFKKKWKVYSGYLNYKEMLEKEEIDILSISTPADTHLKIVQQATKFPIRTIYCEKPIADNVKNAKQIVNLCQRRGILLMVNHQRRFDPFYQELKEKISSGFTGKIQHANCYYTRGILNTGIHIVDIFCFLFGRTEWVEAYKSQNKSPFRDDPNLDGIIRFKNGPLVTLKACDDSSYLILEIDILATRARIRLGKEFEYFQVAGSNNLLRRNELVNLKKPPFKSGYCLIPSLTYGIDHIINCLEKGEKPLSSGKEAAYALKIIEKMHSSAKYGKRYFINYKDL